MKIFKYLLDNLFISLAIISLASFADGNEFDSETIILKLKSQKRDTNKIYTCERTSCKNGVCTTQKYEGPKPPQWCQKESSTSNKNCDWSETCANDGNCDYESNCKEVSNGVVSGFRSFEFGCYKEQCLIKSCEKKLCEERPISRRNFEQEFLNKFPRCNDESPINRQGGGTNALIQYCCDIQKVWQNGKGISGVVRPKRS